MESMDSIAKKTQSLTTAEDMRDQTKLLMQPYANWEEYLTPAPLSIAILGELVFISSLTDFSINKNPPKGGYKYITCPDSFRACLMQVCISVWGAFNEAHKNMDQIRLHTANVPGYVEQAVKIMFQGDDEVVEAHDQLENIKVIPDKCLQLSSATEKRFSDVINTIQELLEVCVNAKHFYGEEMEAIKKKLEEAKLRKQSAEEAKERTQKAMRAMEKQMEEARENYHKALDSLPSGRDMVGMDVVSGIGQSMARLVDGMLTAVVTRQAERYGSSATPSNDNTVGNIRDQGNAIDVVAEIKAYSKSGEILNYVKKVEEQISVNCEDDEIDWTNLFDQKNKCAKTDYMKPQFKRIIDDLQKIPDCPAKTKAQKLCNNGMEICNQLAKYAPDGKCDKDKSNEIKVKVSKLIKSALHFDCKSKQITNYPAIYPKPSSTKAQAQLNNTRETYEKCLENLEKNQKELNDILVTMGNCKLKEIKTTIEMLLNRMGRVNVQWERMAHFFQMVSNILKTSLSKTLKNFVSTSKKTQKFSYNEKLFSKDLLYTQAFQASNIASLVNMISGTYTEIFNKYLMDCVSSLSKLMTMDKSKPEFERERHQLLKACDETQTGILKLVLKNTDEFDKESTARLEKIDREFAVPPKKTKIIEDAVKAGFSEEELSSYY